MSRIKSPHSKYYGCWQYYFKENRKETRIFDDDLLDLKAKVRENKLLWKVIDSKTARKTMKENFKNIFNSGIKNVAKVTGESLYSNIVWTYYYWENNEHRIIRRTYLNELEQDVKRRNLPWIIIDEELAKENYRLYEK